VSDPPWLHVANNVFRLLLVLWAGSLWSSVWVALTVFHFQPDRHLSGVLAARLFSIETSLGLAVALFAALRGDRSRFRYCYLAALVLALNEWVLKRFMDQAQASGSALGLGFGPWHGIAALLYLSACLAVAMFVYKDDPMSRRDGGV
jgi:hypothetical protein